MIYCKMKTLNEIKEVLARYNKELNQNYRVKKESIFGSCVRGDQKKEGYPSTGNIIEKNTASSNTYYGIALMTMSANNILKYNVACGNSHIDMFIYADISTRVPLSYTAPNNKCNKIDDVNSIECTYDRIQDDNKQRIRQYTA